MKPLFPTIILLSALATFSLQAEWHFEGKTIPAPSLKNNLLGDPEQQAIGIILPPSYNESEKHYPVIYTLHGWGDGVGRDWYLDMLETDWNPETSAEFIWVHLSGVNQLRGSFYTNSPVTGNWGDFVAQDVVHFVDSNYRTLPTASNRAITGHSMGGAGCIELAMQRPEVFSILYTLSPGLMIPEDVENWHVAETDLIQKVDKLVAELKIQDPGEAIPSLLKKLKTDNDWRVYFTLGYGMAYAGDPSKPFPYFDYQTQQKDGQKVMIEATLDVYRKGFGNLEAKIQQYETALKNLRLLAIDCGYHDGFPWIYRGSKYFADLLDQHQISHLLILHQGDHGSLLQHQLMHSMIPLVTENFGY